jgi:hypothetical protein
MLFDVQKLIDRSSRQSLLSILDSINLNPFDTELMDYLIDSQLFQRASIDLLAKRGHLNVIRRITEKTSTRRQFAASAQGLLMLF